MQELKNRSLQDTQECSFEIEDLLFSTACISLLTILSFHDMTKDILVSQDHHWRLQFLDHSFPCFQIVHNTKLNLYQQLDNIIIFKLESHHSMSIIEIYPQINHNSCQ